MSDTGEPIVTATISGVAHGGYGIARLKDGVCMVPYALPGDTVNIKIIGKMRGVLWGQIHEVLIPSPERKTVYECPVFGECGGCSWLHFRYPAQCHWKARIVRDCFQRIAKADLEPEWIEDSALRFGYRTRAEFHRSDTGWGFYARESHRVVPIEACPLCHAVINDALRLLQGITKGKSIELTANPETGEVLVWLEAPTPEIESVFPLTDVAESSKTPHEFLFEGVPVVNGAFSQSSLLLNRFLTRVVDEMVAEPASLLDLYCGTGNFSIKYAQHIPVLGVDQNARAIARAASLGVGEYRLLCDEKFDLVLQEREWDVVLLDPPRQGAKKVISLLGESRAKRIVYVSCNPATLARDAHELMRKGWRIQRACVVDMFPHTAHIETVVRFER